MKKALAGLVLALGGSLIILASALPAQAYPELTFEAHTDRLEVGFNDDLVTHSQSSVTCEWTHEWDGKKKKSTGKTADFTWSAPQVTKPTVMPVTFTCAYSSATGGGKAAPTAQAWTKSVNVTVLPAGSAQRTAGQAAVQSAEQGAGPAAAAAAPQVAGVLPNTGGPNMLVLSGGVVLLLLGGAAAWFARRRAE